MAVRARVMMRRSARRAMVRARWAWAASGVPDGRTKLLRGGRVASRVSMSVSRRVMSAGVTPTGIWYVESGGQAR